MMRVRRVKQFPDLRIYVALGLMISAYLVLLGSLMKLNPTTMACQAVRSMTWQGPMTGRGVFSQSAAMIIKL